MVNPLRDETTHEKVGFNYKCQNMYVKKQLSIYNKLNR